MKNKKLNSLKGFTLLELLVVIALLGVFATIVVAALSSSRAKGMDAGIKSTLKSVQSQAALAYSNSGSFATVTTCSTGVFADTTQYGLSRLVTDLQVKSSAVACFAGGQSWVVSAQMKSDPTKYWCVDNGGSSRERTAAATSTAQLCIGN